MKVLIRLTTGKVIKQNAARIWDIGDLEYRVIADFLHELPMEQLADIEGMSPVRTISSHPFNDVS